MSDMSFKKYCLEPTSILFLLIVVGINRENFIQGENIIYNDNSSN